MPKWLYSILITLALPLILLRLVVRSRHNRAYRQHWGQRLGWQTPQATRPVIWVHAVSLGETVATTPLIESLLTAYPDHQVLLTCMTITGAERAEAQFGDRVLRQYLPYDAPFIIKPFVKRLSPVLVILAETELWPNFLTACRTQGIPVLMANGRMNASSAKRYQRSGSLGRGMLKALHHIAAQTADDRQQFDNLGVPRANMTVTGNLKFDQSVPQEQVDQGQAWKQRIARPTWIAASTQPTEEAVILETHTALLKQFPDLLLIIVPRHPERFEWVSHYLTQQKLHYVRQSDGQLPTAEHSVWLGDTMGQLFAYYAAADIAFVGASLAAIGGHSPVEPAALGLPIVMGPHVFKCQHSHDALQAAGALLPIDKDSLLPTMTRLLSDPGQRQTMGKAAKMWVAENQGATARHMTIIARLLAVE